MVQPPCLVALQELKTIPAPEDQLNLLRLLKNDIVGHGQRKELVVQNGLLDPLVTILDSANRSSGKQALDRDCRSSRADLDDDIRLQAIMIVGSLANGGPAFVAPILASNLPQALLPALDPGETSPKVIVATLRSLNAIASAWASLVFSSTASADLSFATLVISKSNAANYLAILQQTLSSPVVYEQISLTASLITTCCVADAPKNTLLKAGLLEALISSLVSFTRSVTHPSDGPTTPSLRVQHCICSILNAISNIVDGSTYRTYRLIYSPSLRALFSSSVDRSTYDDTQGPNFRQHQSTPSSLRLDNLLPRVVVLKPVSFGSQPFPALTAFNTSRVLGEQVIADASISSPIFVWLTYLTRSCASVPWRLATLRLLALVNAALEADVAASMSEVAARTKERERQMALLVVPLAVKLVRNAADVLIDQNNDASDAKLLKEEACAVLARLIQNSVELQTAAHGADAHKYISQILRRSFDPITLARPMWSPQTQPWTPELSESPSSRLGDASLPPEVVHILKCRAGALEAVAAIAEREDPIRKDLIETGIATHMIASLTCCPKVKDGIASQIRHETVNTIPVLLAACRAATAMSRSVGNLRTSLIDAGLGKPVFALLKYPDNAVQIAATDVSINLVLDFSPMREDLIDAGVIQIFCEHARRSSPKLRQVSLWGLKHLVLHAPQAIKHACLEELGSGWLIQAVNGEQRENHSSSSLGMSTANAQGEQVDLLNAPNSPEMDIDWQENGEADDEDGEIHTDHNGTRYQSSGIRSTLESTSYKTCLRILREQEYNPAVQAKQDEVLIQEQALDFIRNLMNGDNNIAMIDHLNNVIGANRIFDMLYNKLKPAIAPAVPMHGLSFNQRHLPLPSAQSSAVWQPPELIRAALGVLIHLAAGSAKHRQQLVAQKQLLNAWLPHFNHPERQVRVHCVWGFINLTWPDNASDREDARRRAMELRTLGFEEKVRSLTNDSDLDTRERVKTAVRQIDDLLEGNARHR